MKLTHACVAAASLLATLGANAEVTGALGGGTGPFLSLTSAGLDGGSIATLAGGTVYGQDMSYASLPEGTDGGFLAAGPSSGNTATLSFIDGVSYLSFLWGSPDTYNRLTVTDSTGSSQTFSAMDLNFAVTNGNQTVSQYVQFTGVDGALIKSLSFTNLPQYDAFESANYSVTPVPEPESYAMLLAGLGIMGFVARRREKR